MSQTAYATKQENAILGLLADLGVKDVISRKLITSALGFGVAVARVDEQNEQCAPVAAGSDKILGIAIRSDSYDNASLAGSTTLAVGSMVSVLRRGRIWCTCVGGCDEDDQVFVVHAGGGLAGADDAGNRSALVGAVWRSDAADGALAILEIDLVGSTGALT